MPRPLLTVICTAAAGLAPCSAQQWSNLPPLPDPLGVAAPFAGISGNALLVGGGANFPDKKPWEGGSKVWHDTVWVLEQPGGVWHVAGSLPRPLAYGVALTVNGGLLCLGGSDSARHYASVFELHWESGKLERREPVPSLPIPLAGAAGAVAAEQTVYVACGSMEPGEKSASNRVFRLSYAWKELVWQEIPPLPAEPRILPVAAALGDTFYLFGGAALEEKDGKMTRRYLRDAWSYSASQGWKKRADMPAACVAAASPAPVIQATGNEPGTIVIVAGDDGTLTGTDPQKHPGFPGHIFHYNTGTDSWIAAGKAPAPRATLPCVPWQGRFIFPSGEIRPGIRSPEVWQWRPSRTDK